MVSQPQTCASNQSCINRQQSPCCKLIRRLKLQASTSLDEITSDHLVLFSSTTTVFFCLVKLGRLPSSVRPGLLHQSPVVERIYLLKVCLLKNETSEKKRTRNQTNIIPIIKIWFNFNQQTYQTALRSLPRPVLVHTCNS